ncbi:MAG: hypothetical protein HUU47_08055 [Bacteroidetes bacterium]|nr:hypothetical protein [Bacteroidota bacterium]
MKKSIFKTTAIVLFVALFVNSTLLKAQEKKTEWKEKNDFHSVMSATFHPSEEGNLEPIKNRSGELVESAKAWMNSTPPKEFDNPKVKKTLKKLYKNSVALDKMIKNKASDEKIKTSLSKLHDIFHQIVEICRHKDGEGH